MSRGGLAKLALALTGFEEPGQADGAARAAQAGSAFDLTVSSFP